MNFTSLLFPFFILLIFLIFFIRPQILVRKFQKNLKPGQHVITSAGILGKVLQINDPFVTIKIDENTTLLILKTHIISVYQ